jgi:hypothetical protein
MNQDAFLLLVTVVVPMSSILASQHMVTTSLSIMPHLQEGCDCTHPYVRKLANELGQSLLIIISISYCYLLFYYSWNGGRAEAVCAGENE